MPCKGEGSMNGGMFAVATVILARIAVAQSITGWAQATRAWMSTRQHLRWERRDLVARRNPDWNHLLRRYGRRSSASGTPSAAAKPLTLWASLAKLQSLFLEQTGVEQRKFLRLLLEEASWSGGELRMSLQEPFEKLRLSNRATISDPNGLGGSGVNSDNWRRGRDSNPRYRF